MDLASEGDLPEEASVPQESQVPPSPSIEDQKQENVEWSPAFQEFVQALERITAPEEKIFFGLQFMRQAISQEGHPHFREFWESRRLILPLFKEALNPAIRSRLWNEYIELTLEARRLKTVFEEQSSFAMEQIDLALQSLEKDWGELESRLAAGNAIEWPKAALSIAPKAALYDRLQRELDFLNILVSRLHALRKEVIKTDMRIRFKTRFFKRLSTLGDQAFPRRKKLIDQVSDEFMASVEHFAKSHFQEGGAIVGAPYYELKEEIKALQGMAKMLTLHSQAFNSTRMLLSQCWDKIREAEKEYRQMAQQKRQISLEACQPIQAKITELSTRAQGMMLRDLDREIDEIVRQMRELSLDRGDVQFLRAELAKLREPHLAVQREQAEKARLAEQERLRLRQERMKKVQAEISLLMHEESPRELPELLQKFEELSLEVKQLDLLKGEKQQLERDLRGLKDFIAEQKEQALLKLSDDERKTLENYRLALQQKRERRQEIKEHLDNYRKALGSSHLDFEKAMLYRELVEKEKELLEKTNAGIEELEQKIAEIEK
jgi:hypothetical protein